MFLCCFLCLLLCLIRRSYRVHNEASKGLKVAETELKEFKSMHDILLIPNNNGLNNNNSSRNNILNSLNDHNSGLNSPYNQSDPKSYSLPSCISHATPIPKI